MGTYNYIILEDAKIMIPTKASELDSYTTEKFDILFNKEWVSLEDVKPDDVEFISNGVDSIKIVNSCSEEPYAEDLMLQYLLKKKNVDFKILCENDDAMKKYKEYKVI